VEFLPEPNAGGGIARQIRSGPRAFAVFATAKLFLERPERHRVRITSSKPEALLYQIGDGPISFDAATVERGAFLQARDEYYAEETTQGEPIKGNFSNVARVRGTGILLGPTNHHSYQPGLRKIYEERFSRRISFPDFQQYEIEVVNDEQTVADWKEQARSSTTFTTKKEAEPISFKTLHDAEQHFRKAYLPTLVKSGITLECDGPASRAALDRHVNGAVRAAWETERAFPQSLVNALRPYFSDAGLQFFKHRKRVLHVSPIKPVRHPENQPFSDGITAILKTIEGQPRIKRPQLALKILGPASDTPEYVTRKEQLAADAHYLIHIGYVIEFSDGAFDLPLNPKADLPAPKQAKKGEPAPAAPKSEALSDADADPEAEIAAAEPPSPEPSTAVAASAEPHVIEAAPPAEEESIPGLEEGEAEASEGEAHAPNPPVATAESVVPLKAPSDPTAPEPPTPES